MISVLSPLWFPCQPFSLQGLKQGFKDKKGRGTILFNICDYIEEQRPKVFILENVLGIVTNNGGRWWKQILKALRTIADCNYQISWVNMNTKFNGVAQNRVRIYIVGILKG